MFAKDLIIESSLDDLYQSAVDAFPNTTKRQYATHPIKIVELKWTPFLGVKTLFVRGLAVNEDRSYNPMILFKGVQYQEKLSKGIVELHINEKEQVFLERLSSDKNEVLVRCDCNDFYWRGNYADWIDKSLWGRKRKKYESKGIYPPVNPTNAIMICKHLMKMTKVLQESGIIS